MKKIVCNEVEGFQASISKSEHFYKNFFVCVNCVGTLI